MEIEMAIEIPDEILENIMSQLGPITLTRASQVSKKWKEFAESNENWKNHLKEKNFSQSYLAKFGSSYKSIFHDEFKKLIAKLPELKNNILEAIDGNLIKVDFLNEFDKDVLRILLSCKGLDALKLGLITQEQARYMRPEKLEVILSDNGITALNEKLITVEQAKEINLSHLKTLYTDKGLQTLREKPMTDELVKLLKEGGHLTLS